MPHSTNLRSAQIFNPTGSAYEGSQDSDTADTYPSRINGLAYVSGHLNFPADSQDSDVTGCVVCTTSTASSDSEFMYDVTFQNFPPPGFASGSEMEVIPGPGAETFFHNSLYAFCGWDLTTLWSSSGVHVTKSEHRPAPPVCRVVAKSRKTRHFQHASTYTSLWLSSYPLSLADYRCHMPTGFPCELLWPEPPCFPCSIASRRSPLNKPAPNL